MPPTFADRLCQAIKTKKTPLVVGLDPRWESLPETFRNDDSAGLSRPDCEIIAAAYQRFCCEIVDVVAHLVPAVKPQSAFFEQLGPAGMSCLAQVVDHAKSRGLLVIMDAKRGDIGSTAEAYAQAYLGEKPQSPWGCDALTVNPFLGGDSLQPFVDTAESNQAGIFVLVKTSNPGSRELQELCIDGEAVYLKIADQVQALAARNTSSDGVGFGFGSVGAVVGATYPEQLAELRQRMPNVLLLIPGFGAQGGTAKDVAGGFRADGLGAIVNSSRGIIFAHTLARYRGINQWSSALEQATLDAITELAAESPAGRLVDV